MTLFISKHLLSANHLRRCQTYLANSQSVRHLVSNSFKVQDPEDFDERVKKSTKPVIVDFFATWCNPCKLLAPRIEHIIDEKKGQVLLAKVDIDENSDLALNYDVEAVPVLVAFQNGEVQARLVGLHDEDELRTFVNKFTNE